MPVFKVTKCQSTVANVEINKSGKSSYIFVSTVNYTILILTITVEYYIAFPKKGNEDLLKMSHQTFNFF